MHYFLLIAAISAAESNVSSPSLLSGHTPYSTRQLLLICCVHRWFEQDPDEMVAITGRCLEDVGGKLGEGLGRLKGVGITNQRETTILWDKTTGRPLYNAIGKVYCVFG